MVGLWLLILVSSSPNLWHTFTELDSILAKVLFVPFVGCLVLFWFYGIYHLVFLIFAYLRKPVLEARARALAKDMPTLKAAIIYTTFNDFNRGAALTCLNQDYPDYHVFILDVSTNPDMKKQVDAFHEEFASAATLIRLQPRQGFKARSLNDALKTAIGDDYSQHAAAVSGDIIRQRFFRSGVKEVQTVQVE